MAPDPTLHRLVPAAVMLVLALGSTAAADQARALPRNEVPLAGAACRFEESHFSGGRTVLWRSGASGKMDFRVAIEPLSTTGACGAAHQPPTVVAPDEDEPLPETLEVVAGDPWFSPAELTISGFGSSIIRLQNAGGVVHNLTVDELGIEIVVTRGGQGEVILTDVKPGTYAFYCSISGHREAGMEGTLIIR